MAREISICIVGAGSSYTPELVDGLIAAAPEQVPVKSIRLMDIDERRLEIMAGLTRRMTRRAKRGVEVVSDTRLDRMLEGCDFVITQIRVGGMKGRHLDESIPLKYGIIGQETTGPGGMLKALRTIGPMIEIARTVAEVCPQAYILNYTNPSGIITEAVSKHTDARIVGLCSGIPQMRRRIHEKLKDRFGDLKTYSVGLNHFGFVHRFVSGGKDVTSEAIELLYEDDRGEGGEAGISEGALARLIQAVPISYVNYFFHAHQKLTDAKAAPETRAQTVEKIEREVLEEASRAGTVSKPAALERRGGGGYSDVTFAVMKAIHHDTGDEIAASVPNRGAVEGIDDDATVEVVCRFDASGPTPLPVGKIPAAYRGLVLALKAYETLTVEAAVTRSKKLATLALMNHPLVGDLDVIEPMLTEMLAAHGLMFE